MFSGLIDRSEIAVAGQSDGGETALAVAYDRYYLDRRVRAAVILSGARLPGGGFDFPGSNPPLLAAQGTADTTNLPVNTYAFFDLAPRSSCSNSSAPRQCPRRGVASRRPVTGTATGTTPPPSA